MVSGSLLCRPAAVQAKRTEARRRLLPISPNVGLHAKTPFNLMNILYETDRLKLENEFEATFLTDKLTGATLMEDDFYDDPACGLIDKNNKWVIVAGEHLTIWTPKKWKRIDNENLQWIHSIRIKNMETVEILTDPWSMNSAIWEINVETFEFKKVKDFNDYKDQEYSENVIW
ncbi:hypothetical protein [uncultured Acetobacteroides sp.]|uniref:hypothetical protein n=1 Tax=uncultured Acetobacteroides sp. TaxID=1760811 RepID=UPI0029F5A564|nr:hypothetical protein [uncultured Acetobacteroides sp.]